MQQFYFSFSTINADAPLSVAGRSNPGLYFLFVVHFSDLTEVCFRFSSALVVAGLLWAKILIAFAILMDEIFSDMICRILANAGNRV